ncbi:SPFH domain-containing protein [Promethearchaeum syntrophicum]|uniref:SPFH domain-containing protein n=1 Tax=Promethearchaeum syntrophicum TaxID=2594042 RepID=A0A5B9D7G5_9ARCH|nr:SPFH domain-containing protein [Candidatus Prometheoarchaeum syntrophicum]QEE15074.1 SPFH domain / Band 7 family protein [Candidatus Prometheoarchaeum syntrophicum]
MIYAEFSLGVAGIVILIVLSIVLVAVFFASRYRKFKTNEYVIHLRNGKVASAGRGGKIIKLPLIDEIVVIPTTTRKTLLNSSDKILSREFQDVKISAILYWRVSEPEISFNAVVWDPRSPDYVERVLSTATEAIIRTTCASLTVETIICDRTEIIKTITDQLLNLTKDWGIVIESLEIIEVQVLDKDLKDNMEAVKKIQEQQRARLANADAKELYRLREIDVSRQSELAEKEMAIQIQQQELTRAEIEAEAYKKATLIRAEADADAIKMRILAEKEAEAIGIRLKMTAEAEGFQKQVDAINSGDQNFLTMKLIEQMPEIYKNISPDKMIVMGEGNKGFNSILESILPLMQILPEFNKQINGVSKDSVEKIKRDKDVTGVEFEDSEIENFQKIMQIEQPIKNNKSKGIKVKK